MNTTEPSISVVLCTYNPRAVALRRVLQALIEQTLAHSRWELLLVDNASAPALAERPEFHELLQRLPARILHEPKLGLTPARLCGFAAARAELLVLIDDDTVPQTDYLEQALRVFEAHLEIGAAGGRIVGEFEREPPAWARDVLGCLAVREFGDRPIRALIHNELGPWEPCGAGMVLRSRVAAAYAIAARSPERQRLDRVGAALSSCGDSDLARTASDLGLYLAYEPALRLHHLIPAGRLRLSYLSRLMYSIQRDGWLLLRLRGDRRRMGTLAYGLRVLQSPVAALAIDPRRWLLRLAARLGQLKGRRLPVAVDGL